jgi:hypothetical protein
MSRERYYAQDVTETLGTTVFTCTGLKGSANIMHISGKTPDLLNTFADSYTEGNLPFPFPTSRSSTRLPLHCHPSRTLITFSRNGLERLLVVTTLATRHRLAARGSPAVELYGVGCHLGIRGAGCRRGVL